jgi:predicted nuclease of predicted toxin-antitoxin system
MKILFDNGTPKPIARSLVGHEVAFARQAGWHELGNGELIQQAEDAGYAILLSTDKNIRYQQNLAGRKIALVILKQSTMARRSTSSRPNRCRGRGLYAG